MSVEFVAALRSIITVGNVGSVAALNSIINLGGVGSVVPVTPTGWELEALMLAQLCRLHGG